MKTRHYAILNRRLDWPAIIGRLNRTKSGKLRVEMGSPGSAQVTRVRLLEAWDHLRVRTEGAMIHLELA